MSQKKIAPISSRTSFKILPTRSSFNMLTPAPFLRRQESAFFSERKLKKIADNLETVVGENESHISYTEQFQEHLESFRLNLKRFLYSSSIGRMYNFAMLILSILSVVEYLYTTYLSISKPNDFAQYTALKLIELIVASIFGFDWSLAFFLADHKTIFLSSFYSMVDILTVFPIFATYTETCSVYSTNEFTYTAKEMLYYVLCALNTTRILRALRVHRVVENYLEDEVERCLAHMALNIIVMILFNSALMQYIEVQQDFSFHTWMYYMTVTIASVGYGDITPQRDIGRFAAMGMIFFAITSVPQMTNELIEKIARQSIYARTRYISKTRNSSHVIVCGNLSSVSWKEFLEELFHEDHETGGLLQCVILQPTFPPYEIRAYLKDNRYGLVLTYLEGSPLNDADLKRADATNARAIFLLTNKFASNPDEEDAKIILEQFSIQKYLRLHSMENGKSTSPLFCLQLIRPENKRHLVTIDQETSKTVTSGEEGGEEKEENREEADIVICLNEIKMGVIAKAVVYPGANTLIMNLLTSFTDEASSSATNAAYQMKPMEGIETLEEDERGSDWIGEYQRGCDWEIYTTALSDAFEGTTFCALAEMLYHKLGIVLFGIEIEEIGRTNSSSSGGMSFNSKKDRSHRKKVYLNPANFVIPPKEDCNLLAFVIAKNKAQADLTFSRANGQDSIFHSGLAFSHISLLANAMHRGHGGDGSEGGGNRSRTGSDGNNSGGGGGGRGGGRSSPSLGGPVRAHKPGEKGAVMAWQLLLRKHESEKTTESIQEELQRREDKHLQENYFTRLDYAVELSDVYIYTTIAQEIPFVENHIIIIGRSLSNLYDLIRPLRVKSLGTLKHIVILYPFDFPLNVWQRISVFESIWILRGSGLEEADLRRCGIFKAKHVILLAAASANNSSKGNAHHPGGGGGVGGGGGGGIPTSALDDVDTVFCYQAVKRMNETAHVVVEIIHHSNVAYLDPESGLNSSVVDYKFTAQFSSGSLFASSILDTLVCQAFYNTKIIEILHHLVGNDSKGDVASLNSTKQANAAAKGLINSSLYQISLPEKLETRTYGALFSLLTKRNQLPVGILRGIFNNTKSGPKANIAPYVFTNPPKDTELFSCDKIFVLSQTPVKITRQTKDETKEFQLYSTIRAKKKTAEDVLNMVNIVKEEITFHQMKNLELETKISSLMEQFQNQMDQVTTSLKEISEGLSEEQREQSRQDAFSPSRRVTGATAGRSASGDEFHAHSSSFPSRARSSTQESMYSLMSTDTAPATATKSPKTARKQLPPFSAGKTGEGSVRGNDSPGMKSSTSPSSRAVAIGGVARTRTFSGDSPQSSPLVRTGRKRAPPNFTHSNASV